MPNTDPRQQLINELYNAVRQQDPQLADIVAKQEGIEACYTHLHANKAKLINVEYVHAWVQAARLYSNLAGSAHEGTAILHRTYECMLEFEATLEGRKVSNLPAGTGTVLWWLGTLYQADNFQRTSERYYTLALCSDIIGENSVENMQKKLGAYPALRTRHRHSETKLTQWTEEAMAKQGELIKALNPNTWIPENLLTHVESSLIYEPPSMPEARAYPINKFFLRRLLDQAEERDGKHATQIGNSLEMLGKYLFQCMPGATTQKKITDTGVPDILVRTIDPPPGFRSTLGEYFLCECKNEKSPTDVQSASQILDALMETNCAFGVLLTLNGTTANADNRIKIAHIRGVTTIITLTKEDVTSLIDGEQLVGILQEKYEKLRFHLREAK